MTGTGTQEDPYVVDNEVDFRTAIGKSGVYVQCVPNMVIDLNDRSPYATTFYIRCKQIDGKSLTIKNGRYNTYTFYVSFGFGATLSQRVGDIINISILDCYNVATSNPENAIIYAEEGRINFRNCTFRVQSVNGYLATVQNASYDTTYFYSCNFVLRKTRLTSSSYGHGCYDCNILIYDCDLYYPNFEFCYISGMPTGMYSGSMKNCIIEPEAELQEPFKDSNNTGFYNCVWNKDRIKSWASGINPKTGLTTEEIRNRQKLYEAGMLINPTEG